MQKSKQLFIGTFKLSKIGLAKIRLTTIGLAVLGLAILLLVTPFFVGTWTLHQLEPSLQRWLDHHGYQIQTFDKQTHSYGTEISLIASKTSATDTGDTSNTGNAVKTSALVTETITLQGILQTGLLAEFNQVLTGQLQLHYRLEVPELMLDLKLPSQVTYRQAINGDFQATRLSEATNSPLISQEYRLYLSSSRNDITGNIFKQNAHSLNSPWDLELKQFNQPLAKLSLLDSSLELESPTTIELKLNKLILNSRQFSAPLSVDSIALSKHVLNQQPSRQPHALSNYSFALSTQAWQLPIVHTTPLLDRELIQGLQIHLAAESVSQTMLELATALYQQTVMLAPHQRDKQQFAKQLSQFSQLASQYQTSFKLAQLQLETTQGSIDFRYALTPKTKLNELIAPLIEQAKITPQMQMDLLTALDMSSQLAISPTLIDFSCQLFAQQHDAPAELMTGLCQQMLQEGAFIASVCLNLPAEKADTCLKKIAQVQSVWQDKHHLTMSLSDSRVSLNGTDITELIPPL